MLTEGQMATIVADEYYLTLLGNADTERYIPEIDPTLVKVTGRVDHLHPAGIVRLELSQGGAALFHADDVAVLR